MSRGRHRNQLYAMNTIDDPDLDERTAAPNAAGSTSSNASGAAKHRGKALATEAEKGYDVDELRRRPGRPSPGNGPSELVPVRLDPLMRSAVEARAEADHTSTSEVIREAIRRYIA